MFLRTVCRYMQLSAEIFLNIKQNAAAVNGFFQKFQEKFSPWRASAEPTKLDEKPAEKEGKGQKEGNWPMGSCKTENPML